MSDLSITLLVIVTGFAITFFYLQRRLSQKNTSTDTALLEWLKSMQKSIDETNKTVNESLNQSSDRMIRTLQKNSDDLNKRLDNAAVVIRDVGKEVGQMSEIGRSMKDLQDFLKSPKLRGNIGEEILKDLISQMFPKNSFHLQYTFKSGERVDAAIKTDAGILPVDSKFPMESYQRLAKIEDTKSKEYEDFKKQFIKDVKKHIDDIAKKYILPDEGTMDFALMYVPSESVFYELCNDTELMNYARRERVYIVSPSTLYAHLQTILLSFEGKKIESRSREVFKLLRGLQIDYEKINTNLDTLGKHLGNAQSQFTNVNTGFTQFGNKLQTTKQIEAKMIDEIENED